MNLHQSTPILTPLNTYTRNKYPYPYDIDANIENKNSMQTQTFDTSQQNPYFMFVNNQKDKQFLKPISSQQMADLRLQDTTQRKKTLILDPRRYDRKKRFIFKR